ncbi:GDSL-type esterase/lipase family protein [Kiritimatiellaeota bacterium B1221]|nr:GDSL-type esterase/lipase family protein [Kiritimatiellaeota bacterium B1221]
MKILNPLLKFSFCLLISGLLASCNPFDDEGDGGGSSGPQTVLVIGDSISGKTNYSGVPPWPTLLADMRPDWTIINRATAGEQMSGGLNKVGGLLSEYTPDSLVIFYGSNNAINQNTDSYESELSAAIQAGKNAGCKVVVCTPPYMYQGRAIYNGGIDVCVAGAKSAAGAHGAKLANINGVFGSKSGDMFPDGLHPDLDGQRMIAVNLREKL